jgi:hypothetical protein
MKKLLVMFPMVGILFFYGCTTPSPAPVVETGTVTTTAVDCQSDLTCIQPLFLACAPATFTPPFTVSSTINLEIIGKVNDICNYKMTRSVQGFLVHKECKVPMSLINTDRAIYLFAKPMDPAELAIDQAQQDVDAQYCVEI